MQNPNSALAAVQQEMERMEELKRQLLGPAGLSTSAWNAVGAIDNPAASIGLTKNAWEEIERREKAESELKRLAGIAGFSTLGEFAEMQPWAAAGISKSTWDVMNSPAKMFLDAADAVKRVDSQAEGLRKALEREQERVPAYMSPDVPFVDFSHIDRMNQDAAERRRREQEQLELTRRQVAALEQSAAEAKADRDQARDLAAKASKRERIAIWVALGSFLGWAVDKYLLS